MKWKNLTTETPLFVFSSLLLRRLVMRPGRFLQGSCGTVQRYFCKGETLSPGALQLVLSILSLLLNIFSNYGRSIDPPAASFYTYLDTDIHTRKYDLSEDGLLGFANTKRLWHSIAVLRRPSGTELGQRCSRRVSNQSLNDTLDVDHILTLRRRCVVCCVKCCQTLGQFDK